MSFSRSIHFELKHIAANDGFKPATFNFAKTREQHELSRLLLTIYIFIAEESLRDLPSGKLAITTLKTADIF